jgi:hypothetical protein
VIPVSIVVRTLAEGGCRRLLLRSQREPAPFRTHRILFPQKQLGSIRSDVGPTIRNWICAPQEGFGHSHHSSRLFTNVTSARFNASRDTSFRRERPHNANGIEESKSVPQSSLPMIWLFDRDIPPKRFCPLIITTGTAAVGFHPKIDISQCSANAWSR